MTPKALADHLARIDLGEICRQALDDAATRLETAVKAALSEPPGGQHDAPWLRTGDLRDSIGHQADASSAIVGSTSDVAVFQERGTARLRPRPFLAPAAVALGPELARRVGEQVAAVLRPGAPLLDPAGA
ncbi:MAG TPA: HK97 gp10 family phage protein [Acetobacteraceae bacterium]|nr:HK97 gp10 family phage protein [Acetobacteraceae bacterium]